MAGHSPTNDTVATPWPALICLGHHAGKPPIPLGRAVTLVGSRHNAHLHLLSRQISKAHALILNSGHQVYLHDLCSRTHVYVNGLEAGGAVLNHGDFIQIGGFQFKFSAGPEPQRRSHARKVTHGQLIVDGNLSFPITKRVMLLGRRPSCDIALLDPSVSTAHAVVFEMNGRRYVRDLGSRSGTQINDQPVKQSEIRVGDRIRIGVYELSYAQADEEMIEQAQADEASLLGLDIFEESPAAVAPVAPAAPAAPERQRAASRRKAPEPPPIAPTAPGPVAAAPAESPLDIIEPLPDLPVVDSAAPAEEPSLTADLEPAAKPGPAETQALADEKPKAPAQPAALAAEEHQGDAVNIAEGDQQMLVDGNIFAEKMSASATYAELETPAQEAIAKADAPHADALVATPEEAADALVAHLPPEADTAAEPAAPANEAEVAEAQAELAPEPEPRQVQAREEESLSPRRGWRFGGFDELPEGPAPGAKPPAVEPLLPPQEATPAPLSIAPASDSVDEVELTAAEDEPAPESPPIENLSVPEPPTEVSATAAEPILELSPDDLVEEPPAEQEPAAAEAPDDDREEPALDLSALSADQSDAPASKSSMEVAEEPIAEEPRPLLNFGGEPPANDGPRLDLSAPAAPPVEPEKPARRGRRRKAEPPPPLPPPPPEPLIKAPLDIAPPADDKPPAPAVELEVTEIPQRPSDDIAPAEEVTRPVEAEEPTPVEEAPAEEVIEPTLPTADSVFDAAPALDDMSLTAGSSDSAEMTDTTVGRQIESLAGSGVGTPVEAAAEESIEEFEVEPEPEHGETRESEGSATVSAELVDAAPEPQIQEPPLEEAQEARGDEIEEAPAEAIDESPAEEPQPDAIEPQPQSPAATAPAAPPTPPRPVLNKQPPAFNFGGQEDAFFGGLPISLPRAGRPIFGQQVAAAPDDLDVVSELPDAEESETSAATEQGLPATEDAASVAHDDPFAGPAIDTDESPEPDEDRPRRTARRPVPPRRAPVGAAAYGHAPRSEGAPSDPFAPEAPVADEGELDSPADDLEGMVETMEVPGQRARRPVKTPVPPRIDPLSAGYALERQRRRSRRTRGLTALLVLAILVTAAALWAIWHYVRPQHWITGTLQLGNFSELRVDEQRQEESKLLRLLDDPKEMAGIRQTARSALGNRQSPVAPGFLESDVGFVRQCAWRLDTARGALLFRVYTDADAASLARMESLLKAVWAHPTLRDRAAGVAKARKQLATVSAELYQKEALINRVQSDLSNLRFVDDAAIAALNEAQNEKQQAYLQAVRTLQNIEEELRRLAQAPADSGAVAATAPAEDGELAQLIQKLERLKGSAAGTGHSIADARKVLDEATKEFDATLAAAQKLSTSNAKLSDYVAATQRLQQTTWKIIEDLIQSRRTDQDLLAGLKQQLDEEMEANRLALWASDPLLKDLNNRLALKTREYNAATADKLPQAEALKTEIEKLNAEVENRKKSLGSDQANTRVSQALRQYIEDMKRKMSADRKRIDESMAELDKSLSAAAPQVEQLQGEQKVLAEKLRSDSERVAAARRALADAAGGQDAELAAAIRAEVRNLEQRIEERRRKIEDERRMSTDLQHRAALAARQERLQKELPAAQQAVADARKASEDAQLKYLTANFDRLRTADEKKRLERDREVYREDLVRLQRARTDLEAQIKSSVDPIEPSADSVRVDEQSAKEAWTRQNQYILGAAGGGLLLILVIVGALLMHLRQPVIDTAIPAEPLTSPDEPAPPMDQEHPPLRLRA